MIRHSLRKKAVDHCDLEMRSSTHLPYAKNFPLYSVLAWASETMAKGKGSQTATFYRRQVMKEL